MKLSEISTIKRLWRGLRDFAPFNQTACRLGRSLLPSGPLKQRISEHLPYRGTVRYPLPDGRSIAFKSYGDDFILNLIFWNRIYEPELSGIFYRFAEKARCTLDIGAHVGFYALLAGAANPQNRVYAFEPMPRIYHRLLENIQINRLASVQAIHSAVGREAGSIELFHIDSPYIPSNSTTREQTFLDAGKDYARTPVPLTTIDDFCSQRRLERVDLIKMDTEGTEFDALKGAAAVLQRDHPTIVCEVLEALAPVQALEDLLAPLGYHYYRLEGNGPIPLERIQGSRQWWNFLFTTQTWDELKGTLGIRG